MEDTIKQARGSFSKFGGFFMLGTLVIFAVQLLPAFILQIVKPEWMNNGDIALLVTIIPMYVLGMPFLIWLLKKLPAQTPQRHVMSAGQFGVSFLMCYAIMFCCNLLGNIVTMVIGLLKGGAVQNTILDVATSSNMVITFVYMVICAPVFEEYIFRKLIIDSTMRYGQGVAILLSGLMFGLFHGNLNQFVYAFGLGLFLAFLYVRTGSLKISIALHMIINFLGGIVGVLILQLIDMQGLTEALASGDTQVLMEYYSSHLAGWVVYGVYAILILAAVITGVVLLIVFRKRFTLPGNERVIPRGRGFSTVILNPGMAVYCLFWLAMILLQLFQ